MVTLFPLSSSFFVMKLATRGPMIGLGGPTFLVLPVMSAIFNAVVLLIEESARWQRYVQIAFFRSVVFPSKFIVLALSNGIQYLEWNYKK